MSKAWLVVLSVASISFCGGAFAATDDPADPSSANLVNLNYYLRPGKLRARVGGETSIEDNAGSFSTTFTQETLYLEYGLPLEGLRLSVADSYEYQTSDNGTDTFVNKGFTDPYIYLNYRFMDAPGDGWSLDGELFYSPNVATDDLSSNTAEGNEFRGYAELGASFGLYWRAGSNEAELSGSVEENLARTGVLADGTAIGAASRVTGDLELTDRIHLSPRFFIEPLVEFIFSTNIDETYSDGNSATYSYPFRVMPELVLGYLPTSRILITVYSTYNNYSYNESASFSVTSPAKVDSTYLGLNVNYEF